MYSELKVLFISPEMNTFIRQQGRKTDRDRLSTVG